MKACKIDLVQVGLWNQPVSEKNKLFDHAKFSNSGLIYEDKISSGVRTAFENVYKLSVYPSVWWPKQKNLFLARGRNVSNSECVIGYLNVIGIKDFSIASSIVREISKLVKERKISRDARINILFSVTNFYCALCLKRIKTILPNSKIVLNILDIPGLVESHKSKIERFLKKRILNKFKILTSKYADGFILISKYMSDLLQIEKKPHLVIPGICYEFSNTLPSFPHQICYAGVIRDDYLCTKVLIDAFRKAKSLIPDLKLVICGPGTNNYLFDNLQKGSIEYLGNLSPREVDMIQSSSGILINLRENLPFFRYSFPSKITNYLSLGRPIIQSNLDSIPEYIRDALVMIDDVNADSVAKAIIKCITMTEEKRRILLEKESVVCKELSPQSVAAEIQKLFDVIR